MDGDIARPNQWNPETAGDDAAFDRFLIRIARMSEKEFAAAQAPVLPALPLPGASALERLAANFESWIGRERRKFKCAFPDFTPSSARANLERRGVDWRVT